MNGINIYVDILPLGLQIDYGVLGKNINIFMTKGEYCYRAFSNRESFQHYIEEGIRKLSDLS